MTDNEFIELLEDDTKAVNDVVWAIAERSTSLEFRSEVANRQGWPLIVHGRYVPEIEKVVYCIVCNIPNIGAIYRLDVGQEHKNPDGKRVGDPHKHRWTKKFGDKVAYEPPDVTAPASDPELLWRQFCAEAKLQHQGQFKMPEGTQGRLFT